MPAKEQPAKPSGADRPVAPAGASTTSLRAVWAARGTGPAPLERHPASAPPQAQAQDRTRTETPGMATSAAPPAFSHPSPLPARGRAPLGVIAAVGHWIAGVWSQPKVRLVLIGTCLLVLGAFLLTSSVWTLPLTISGALLLLIASIGSRLDGRFVVDWGRHGTQLEFRAEIKSSIPRPTQGLRLAPVPEDGEVIEGEAHTVEIDVGELKALIAAVEADQSRGTVPRAG